MEDERPADMGDPVRSLTASFSQWAIHGRKEAFSRPEDLCEEKGSSNHSCSTALMKSCCGLLEAIDGQHLGKECCKELLRDGVFRALGEGVAADWEGISERLVQQTGKEAHNPAWLQTDLRESGDAVQERLRRACCSSEVVVLMLRLAVRSACLASSWYGPWESMEALHQLVRADVWVALLRALRALLTTFGPDLGKQCNAINIVSDILHVMPSTPPAVFLASGVVAGSAQYPCNLVKNPAWLRRSTA